MKKVLKFTVRNTYNNARKIADYIIDPPTYSSIVKRTILDVILGKDPNQVSDVYDICHYTITIYEMPGNRKSILSPSQNEIYRSIISTNELSDIISKFDMTINKLYKECSIMLHSLFSL